MLSRTPESLFIGGKTGKSGPEDSIFGATDVRVVSVPVGVSSDGRQLVEEEIRFKLSKANFAKAKKIAERPERPDVHIETLGGMHIPFATTAEFDIAARTRSRYMTRLGKIGINSMDEELMFTTVPAVSGSVRDFFVPHIPRPYGPFEVGGGQRRGEAVPPLHRSLVSKFRLMYQFARGLQDLHQMGYQHLNITHNSLIFSSCSISPHTKVRGFLTDFSISSAAGVARSEKTDEIRPLPIYSLATRTDPRYRAPESFLMKRGQDVFPRIGDIANNNYFECTEKTDIFSLGLCFVIMILGLHPFTYTIADHPFLSRRGLERLLALSRSTDDSTLQLRAFEAECTKWQTFKLLGKTTDNDYVGDERRWLTVCTLVQRAIHRGFLPGITQDALGKVCDLLWGMLFPNPKHRMSIHHVVNHAVFAQFREEEAKFPPLADPFPQFIQFAPRNGWSSDKDVTVVSAMQSLFKNPNVMHLPFETLFIAYDLAARVAGTFENPANPLLLKASVAAAIRVSILLYDVAQSLSFDFEDESALSWQIVPYVVEYFGGLLRRKDFLFSNLQRVASTTTSFGGGVSDGVSGEDLTRAVSKLFVEESGVPFREIYLMLDAPLAAEQLASEFLKSPLTRQHVRNGVAATGSPASADVCFQDSTQLKIKPPTIAELFYSRT